MKRQQLNECCSDRRRKNIKYQITTEMETITSPQNPKIKRLMLLQQKSSERKREGLFVVEGSRELQHCINAGFEVDTVFYNSALLTGDIKSEDTLTACLPANVKCYEVSEKVYEKIAYRGGTEGVVAQIKTRNIRLEDLKLGETPLIMVVESVEKPGNLGAILRSADAASADAVIICDPLTDLFNPNLIRSSVGTAFTVPCVACRSDECIAFLKARGISILTAQLQDSKLYYDTDMRRATAIVMGTEATGLTNQWREAADAHIRIPMLGMIDSLNVSVSAAILLFEAVRQRNIQNKK